MWERKSAQIPMLCTGFVRSLRALCEIREICEVKVLEEPQAAMTHLVDGHLGRIIVRAGDVAKAMRLKMRIPFVC